MTVRSSDLDVSNYSTTTSHYSSDTIHCSTSKAYTLPPPLPPNPINTNPTPPLPYPTNTTPPLTLPPPLSPPRSALPPPPPGLSSQKNIFDSIISEKPTLAPPKKHATKAALHPWPPPRSPSPTWWQCPPPVSAVGRWWRPCLPWASPHRSRRSWHRCRCRGAVEGTRGSSRTQRTPFPSRRAGQSYWPRPLTLPREMIL